MPKFTANEIDAGRTFYSQDFPGDDSNYNWPASVSVTAPGYVRIAQSKDRQDDEVVLLSPEQWRAIVAFAANPKGTE